MSLVFCSVLVTCKQPQIHSCELIAVPQCAGIAGVTGDVMVLLNGQMTAKAFLQTDTTGIAFAVLFTLSFCLH